METRSHLEPYSSRPTTGRSTEISVWHVAVSPDDVKVMTLEQLDDAFRLDVIDTSTPVWKNGMSTWSPLGIVAGIEDEATTTTVRQEPQALWPPPSWPPRNAAPASAAPNRPTTRSPAPPVLRPTVPPSGPAREAPVSARPAPAVSSTRPAPPSSPPAPVSEPARPVPSIQVVSSYPMPASVAPTAFSVATAPYRPRGQSSAFGFWLVGLASVFGLVLTLYRNDVLLRAARASHHETEYLRLERAFLGGPSFGTLRSIDTLKALRERLASLTNPAPSTPPVAAAAVLPEAAAGHPAPSPTDKAAPSAPDTRTSETAARAVDLKSLPVESEHPAPATRPEPEQPKTAAARLSSAKVPASSPATRTKERDEKPAATEAPSDALKAAMVTGRGAKASSARADRDKKEAPGEAAPAAVAAKDAAPKPADVPRSASGTLDLKAAMGDAVRRHPPKKKAKGSEYDPLNGDL